jgi:hypothetical protein
MGPQLANNLLSLGLYDLVATAPFFRENGKQTYFPSRCCC